MRKGCDEPTMGREVRVLILEDVVTDPELCEGELRRAGPHFASHRVETRIAFKAALDAVVILGPDAARAAGDGTAVIDGLEARTFREPGGDRVIGGRKFEKFSTLDERAKPGCRTLHLHFPSVYR